MNEALQRWREDFEREPDTAFDRLVRGLVPLGAVAQLSFGEILDGVFEPGDPALDDAAANWLGKRILGTVPDNSTLHRWVSVLEEYFRGIAAMELPKTGEILHRQHKRLRLWLHGFYEGPDRDPEGAYLLALVRAQHDQRFSPLWRRLILGEELTGRPYLGIGILGFRKMPGPDGRAASDVPDGLLQALVKLADKSGTGQAKWKQTMRSLFATYRRSESYWVEHLAPLLPDHRQKPNARDWLSAMLPGIADWHPTGAVTETLLRRVRAIGRLDDARKVYEQACQDFPRNQFCRNGLAETLRAIGRLDDARKVYEQTCKDFPRDVACRDGLADLLIDLDEADEAERIYREALEIDERNQYARGGLARALSIRSARNRDVELRDEAKRMLQQLADEGSRVAKSGLRVFDDQWERATTDPAITFRREVRTRQPQVKQTQQGHAIADMSAAERLGRAMIALWQAERAEDASLRSSLCIDANTLLDMPEDQVADDLLAAFVETRGLVLLASGDVRRALAYFEEQIRLYGRGCWIGVRLGEKRAHILLSEPGHVDDAVEQPTSQSARFALHVAQVIQALSSAPQESAALLLLKSLYPKAAEFAGRVRPDAKKGLVIESGAEMLSAFLQTRWFRPAGIQSAEDLDRPDALHAVVERINNTRMDTFEVISNSTLALAA